MRSLFVCLIVLIASPAFADHEAKGKDADSVCVKALEKARRVCDEQREKEQRAAEKAKPLCVHQQVQPLCARQGRQVERRVLRSRLVERRLLGRRLLLRRQAAGCN